MFSSTGIKRSQSFPTNPLTTTTPQANSSPQLTSQISDFTHINPVGKVLFFVKKKDFFSFILFSELKFISKKKKKKKKKMK